ncbi:MULTISPECIES: sulfur oxidation c-type cytochrome SoxA [unclassified Mesorhizobium]|uniref:sulfur oxidation c-type cytochrome SoxA n=1 Tax=unclassified Mesorhizobium TaxID=325217 RepID=UPI000FE49BC1|nr:MULTISPECIES: sulfur oxidation c-type cytochrome SoxA [unclassified Mesorhizobium]RWB36132.1 MAG: sulfur oxidation c-type cytochrome SoxA [Mesorhizobium sp.]RWC24041.1 MAG: sulfur oxidation c-type cytochrome SoxA [Mesorhizobium sp.]RWD47969.1 MAG: sulfur oxidation c-type cytochrome SoxA [Mesorhizobium sp.]RWE69338.1 MAG: sulfur oxidation c-type cytochrome SoxA [Mesorhizobium sp.]TGT94876.1 sulfur oxidation c-type cytochrome SoxA [Mesorhizobium sp. M5C.F.Ca.ET.164.01.1.1]
MHALWRLAALGVAAICGIVSAAGTEDSAKRSGFDFMTPETQALQVDDTSNPGMLWVLQGEQLWQQAEGRADVACTGCHGHASQTMRGVATRYPAFDEAMGRPIDLAGRINSCRAERQQAEPLTPESDALLALTAYVAHQSRGMPIIPATDARLAPFRDNGRRLFQSRIGQLDLSCASCHDDNWGKRLGGSVIPQAHPTGYPLYRLEWQTIGSLQRRLRNCMIGVRAEPFAFSAPELVELELHLMERARGLLVETPAVRP